MYIFCLFSRCTCFFRLCLISTSLPARAQCSLLKVFSLSLDRYTQTWHSTHLSVCPSVSKDLLTLPFSLLPSLWTLFSRNVGSKPPASKSMPLCTCSLLSWLFSQVPLEFLNPTGSALGAWMCLIQRKKASIPGKEVREEHTSFTCTLEDSPSVLMLPNLCLLAPLLLTTPSAFQLAMSDVSLVISLLSAFPQPFLGASSSCTSPTPPSHSCKLAISPTHGSLMGREASTMEPLLKAALPVRTPISLCPWFLLGSTQPPRHSCLTSLTSHSFHYALLLSGCLNPPAIQP